MCEREKSIWDDMLNISAMLTITNGWLVEITFGMSSKMDFKNGFQKFKFSKENMFS